jgi:hypothetical protein
VLLSIVVHLEMDLSFCMMNTFTLLKGQLFHLPEEQQQVISEYYQFVRNSVDIPPDGVQPDVDKAIHFWEIADANPEVATWLEFIDFFFIPSPDKETLFNEDCRAYLSEHILLLALQKHPEAPKLDQLLDTWSTLILRCPDESGSFTLPQAIMESNDWRNFMQEKCSRCDRPFFEHEMSFAKYDQGST